MFTFTGQLHCGIVVEVLCFSNYCATPIKVDRNFNYSHLGTMV